MTAPRGSRPCAIFDLDGTLAHTAPDLIGAANDLFAGRGFEPMPLSVAEKTAGFGGKALIRAAFKYAGKPVDEAQVDALYQPFLDRYAERICDESMLYDGVIETLDALWRARMSDVLREVNDTARAFDTTHDGPHRFRAGAYFHNEDDTE